MLFSVANVIWSFSNVIWPVAKVPWSFLRCYDWLLRIMVGC